MINNRLLNYLIRRWYNISRFTDRRDLVGWLLDYMKKYNISDRYKEQIYNVVLKLPKKTDLQKKDLLDTMDYNQLNLKKKHYLQFQEKNIVLQML